MPTIVFGGGARMQGHGLATFLLRDMTGLKERLVLMIDADTDLGRHRHIRRIADLDHALDDLTEQIRLPRQCRSAAAPRHLGYGATEIEIDMIGHVLVDNDLRRLFHDRRIHAVELQRTDFLAGSETAQPQCLGITGHQCTRGNHLGHI